MKRLAILMIGLVFSLSACADTSTIGASGGAAGIQGKVLLGPMCPVQQAGSPCPDKPIKADIAVTASEGKTVASGRSDESGTYRISLPPGSRRCDRFRFHLSGHWRRSSPPTRSLRCQP